MIHFKARLGLIRPCGFSLALYLVKSSLDLMPEKDLHAHLGCLLKLQVTLTTEKANLKQVKWALRSTPILPSEKDKLSFKRATPQRGALAQPSKSKPSTDGKKSRTDAPAVRAPAAASSHEEIPDRLKSGLGWGGEGAGRR